MKIDNIADVKNYETVTDDLQHRGVIIGFDDGSILKLFAAFPKDDDEYKKLIYRSTAERALESVLSHISRIITDYLIKIAAGGNIKHEISTWVKRFYFADESYFELESNGSTPIDSYEIESWELLWGSDAGIAANEIETELKAIYPGKWDSISEVLTGEGFI